MRGKPVYLAKKVFKMFLGPNVTEDQNQTARDQDQPQQQEINSLLSQRPSVHKKLGTIATEMGI